MKPPVYNEEWPDDVKALYRHDMEEIWDPAITPHIWNVYHNQLEIYSSFADRPGISILDVGCAQGTLALHLAEQDHQVTAIDIRPQFLEYAKSRYTHGNVNFLTLDAMIDSIPGKYDLIFANQIIEHLVYPDELCSRLFAVLKPGGRLVVTTPNYHYIMSALPSYRELGDPTGWEHMQNSADGDGHFYAYRAEELASAFSASNFVDVSVRPFETPAISGHMKIRYLHGRVPISVLKFVERTLLAVPVLRFKLAHQLLCTGVRPG